MKEILIERVQTQIKIRIYTVKKKINSFSNSPWNLSSMQIPRTTFWAQYSDVFVEYEKGFDMKTGKIILDMADTKKTREDEESYIQVTFF